MTIQNTRMRILDRVQKGGLTTDDGNVEMVLQERFRVVHRLPMQVRRSLQKAVREGTLGHIKKDGVKSEIFYNPNFKYLAIAERANQVDQLNRAMKRMTGFPMQS